MIAAPIQPHQSGEEWVNERIKLAMDNLQRQRMASAPAPTAPTATAAPVAEETASQQIARDVLNADPGDQGRVHGWNGRIDGFYQQGAAVNSQDWANTDHLDWSEARPGVENMPEVYSVSTLTAPGQGHQAPNGQPSSSEGYSATGLNPALLMQPQQPQQTQAQINGLKRKASPISSSSKPPSKKTSEYILEQTTASTSSSSRPSPPRSNSRALSPLASSSTPAYTLREVKAVLTGPALRSIETPAKLKKYLLEQDKAKKRPFEAKPEDLVDLLKTIRTGQNNFMEGFAGEVELMKLLGSWYRLALKEPESYKDILPYLLQLISRLPVTVEVLIECKLGGLLRKKLPEGSSDDLKRKREAAMEHVEKIVEEDKRAKRPRPNPAASSSKSSAVTAAAARPGPRAPAKAVASSDMSFFESAPKSKPKTLPSFKKVPKPPAAATSAAAASTNAFASTFSQLSAAAAAAKTQVPVLADAATTGGKKKKSVRFRDVLGGLIADIKLFKQEAYEFGDEIDLHGMSSHDLDMEEGKALKVHGVEETIDWYDPDSIALEQSFQRGGQSAERIEQDERERTVLAVNYLTLDEIPPSADESQVTSVTHDQMTGLFLLPQTYPTLEYQPVPQAPVAAVAPPPGDALALQNLLAKIQANGVGMQGGFGYGVPQPQPQYGAYPLAQAVQGGWGQQQQQQQPQHLQRGPSYGQVRSSVDRTPVVGTRTRPCRNFNSPKGCTFGDQCHFAHVVSQKQWH